MQNKQNLHTHSTFCDGVNTPREMIEIAMEKGFDSLGFSEHSPMYYSPSYGMTEETTQLYIEEVLKLKKEYAGKFDVFCGIEYDIFSGVSLAPYAYAIGSVHYLPVNGELVGIDRSEEIVESVIRKYFSGDGLKCAKCYYETLAKLPDYGKFDIVGHFDIIAKHSENRQFFDENSKEYMGLAVEAAEALAGKVPLFEVNTGAIARGYRKAPYPSIPIIKELRRLGFGAVISSDCHNGDFLDCNFSQAREILRLCGYKERYIFTDAGFQAVAL